MHICVLSGKHGVNTGNFCGFDGKNTVIPAISVSHLGKQTQVVHYAEYYYARLKFEKGSVWGVKLGKAKQPHRKIDEAATRYIILFKSGCERLFPDICLQRPSCLEYITVPAL